MQEILENEIEKLKISNTEREILIEEFEWNWELFEERFVNDNKRKPTEKEGLKYIKEYLSENAMIEKGPMRQVEKENGQIQCLLNALKREHQHLTIEEMSELLIRSGFTKGSSVKTIYRRIRSEFPKYDIKMGTDGKYYYDDSFDEQRKINKAFEKNELGKIEIKESITILSNFLETIKDSPVYDKAATFIENEKKKIKQTNNGKLENFTRVLFMGAPETNVKKETWEIIYKAMELNAPLSITYTSEGKKQPELYGVRPYQLIFDNGSWELWAECLKQKHEGMRLFNISRISEIKILEGTTYKLPADYNFMNKVTGSFGCYKDEFQKKYKIKFKKDSYAWLYSKDRIWGDKQIIEELDDGFILSFEANQFKPILRWVLGWGDEVIPIEPEELVVEWKKKITNMSKSIIS